MDAGEEGRVVGQSRTEWVDVPAEQDVEMSATQRGRPLKVGVQLPEIEYEPRWTDLARMARTAEDIGLDSVAPAVAEAAIATGV